MARHSLCDYNGPLLARDFSRHVSPARFVADLEPGPARCCAAPCGHDLIDLDKMPETVGAQPNPMLHLDVTPHVNNAYLTSLADDWETFYAAKRSSATRRPDRTKQQAARRSRRGALRHRRRP